VQVGQVSSLIIAKVKMMTEAEDLTELHTKHKVVVSFLSYAIWQERGGKPEMLNTCLAATRTSGKSLEWWYQRIGNPPHSVLREATPRAVVLVSPHIPWHLWPDKEGFVQLWVAAASVVQYTEEVARCVVGTMLVIASHDTLLQYLTVGLWSWLTKRPTLHPFCMGRDRISHRCVVKAVRGLGDIEILKSYLLIAWSEERVLWNSGLNEMCAVLREDFGGVGTGHHRADLVQLLDQILNRLKQGFEPPERFGLYRTPRSHEEIKDHYEKLKNILLEVNVEAVSRTSYLL